MKCANFLYKNHFFILEKNTDNINYNQAQLVIGFGSRELISSSQAFKNIQEKFPNAQIVLCSSAGEIYGVDVFDDTISLIVLSFDSSNIFTAQVNIDEFPNSFEAGKALYNALPQENLKLVLILSDGSKVNGSELVKGLNLNKPQKVLITGGLAGDGARFEQTFVGLNDVPQSGNIAAIGFYGNRLDIAHGSIGGWESFGLERRVTKANYNVLYEIDDKNALDLYKTYLGKYAEELPGSALLFPLSIKLSENQEPIVRTILSIDEKNQTMTFAGDIPVGSKVRFMKANFDRLIDAASDAAKNCVAMSQLNPKLAILISCVGRKLILANRIEEEVEAVVEIFGNKTTIAGFYSYGEISPLKPMTNCELHNQTMTITCINEID